MQRFLKTSILLSTIFLFYCGKGDDTIAPTATPTKPVTTVTNPTPQSDTKPEKLVSLNGNQLLDAQGQPLYLQGVAFGNEIWNNSSSAPVNHHSEIDYQRVSAMGMNAIRFYLNYKLFESDTTPYNYRQEGWDWLDKNIAWAKKYGVYLVLNMHAPQGGYQSQGKGDALWDDVANQNRLIALWKAIAERYREEGQIVGFGPVNEPVPSQSMAQWSALAQKLIDGIQSVNRYHMLFIEKAIFVQGNYKPDSNYNFPVVTGENIIYEFHGYDPHKYTHQLMDFTKLPDGGKYPDETILEVSDGDWYTATFDNPRIEETTRDWTYFEGVKYKITDPKIAYASPALIGANVNGRIYFDDLSIKEYDDSGNFVRSITEMNLNTTNNWYYWSNNQSGTYGLGSKGHNDTNSLYIEKSTDDCNISNPTIRFVPKQNYSYQISGWMKSENIASNSDCKFRLDMYSSNGAIHSRNKTYLRYEMDKFVDWAAKKNVPLYMGEFGTGYPSFQNNKGGIKYVKDLLDLAREYKVHFTYHTYHEDSFGLYLGSQKPDPNNVNQPLIDLFTKELGN